MRPLILGMIVLALLGGAGEVQAGADENDPVVTDDTSFQLKPIGTVVENRGRTFLEIKPELADAIDGLKVGRSIWVLWWFDRNDTPERRSVLKVHPRGNPANPLRGVFATRSPVRPNLIALTLCRIIGIEGSRIEVESIDAFPGTPVLDIKPYVPGMDEPGG
jgi:tRNA-Thr(GGU) m(6)t(6)A37 methyltransferase TsaA